MNGCVYRGERVPRKLGFLGLILLAHVIVNANSASASEIRWTTDNDVPCDSSACCSCCTHRSGLFDFLTLFMGLEGSKQPQDFGVNAHFGGRFAANWGVPLLRNFGLGAQLGTSINYTDNAVQVFERTAGETERAQVFTTVGVFQRTPSGFVWAIGYDYLHQDYYDTFNLGQWRGQFGVALGDCNEAGVRLAFSGGDDEGQIADVPLTLEPITQGSLYFRRFWQTGGQTTLWVGLAEGHSEVNFALGDLEPTSQRLLFGADLHLPLNDWLAVWGEANFITPADTGTVDAYLGLAFYPRGGAISAFRSNFFPVLPLANSPSFSVDLNR